MQTKTVHHTVPVQGSEPDNLLWIVLVNLIDLVLLFARAMRWQWPHACIVLWVAAVIWFYQAEYTINGLWIIPLGVIMVGHWLNQRYRRRRR